MVDIVDLSAEELDQVDKAVNKLIKVISKAAKREAVQKPTKKRGRPKKVNDLQSVQLS